MKPVNDVFVFLGPSLPQAEAAEILDATYLPPIKRGDLSSIGADATAVIIDGVFEQDLSVSPAEIVDAIGRGVRIFGGGSMGALRAAEIPGVTGIGKIFEWFRDGIISRDDEVALLFNQDTALPITIPTVNVRYAVERLCSLGTIDRDTGRRIISAALAISFKRRTYPHIFSEAGLAGRVDSNDLIAMLKAYDLKAQDARTILEAVARMGAVDETATTRPAASIHETHFTLKNDTDQLIWETGDRATMDELLDFLIFTGKMKLFSGAFAALGTACAQPSADPMQVDTSLVQSMFENAAKRWGWISTEEAQVTLSDLDIRLENLSDELVTMLQDRGRLQTLVKERAPGFMQQLLSRLFLDDLTLKRELMRLAGLRYFAERFAGTISPARLKEARQTLCKLHQTISFSEVIDNWNFFGLTDEAKQERFVETVAAAREAAWLLTQSTDRNTATIFSDPRFLTDRPKHDPNERYAFSLADAHREAVHLAGIIGVTRIGMIGELSGLSGAFVAQAARPGNAWSSSYGSGKSLAKEGAVVGSIMEELEKWAQEKFMPSKEVKGSFVQLREQLPLADPSTFDLPYDTIYNCDLILTWHPAVNILDNTVIYVPANLLTIKQEVNDILFSARGARKVLATNGLGAGFSREEAVLHGLCEYVERHAQRMIELRMTNPGSLLREPQPFVRLDTCGEAIRQLYQQIAADRTTLRVLDISSEIGIPTFLCVIMRNFQRAEGFGCHPNAKIAVEMAMLEAYQTIASSVAGGREDLSIKARSLGRHERPRPNSAADGWYWLDPDATYHDLDERKSFVSGNVLSEIEWCVGKIREAGCQSVIVADITPQEIAPAHVTRVFIPGLETNSPFYLGPRGRAVLISDIVPAERILNAGAR